MDDTALHRPARGLFTWEGVERRPYKEDDAALFKNISRQILFSDPALAGELRYFEVEPGGFSTLERHEHAHGVMVVRGRGRCLLGDAVRDLAPMDLVRIPAWTWHQFRPAPGETLGFLCMVNAERDRPALPTPEELADLRTVPAVADFLAAR